MRFVPRMWDNLRAGRSFDAILVVTATTAQRDRLRRHFRGNAPWTAGSSPPLVQVAALDELGRPWRGGNFDASLFAVQGIRRLLRRRGIPEGDGRSLAVLAAGERTRAYPLTAAEGGSKSMIRTPAEMGGRSLRLVELVIAQYHQILDDVEPGRIHIAAGDHILGWTQPPRTSARHHVQIFANRTSFADEAKAAGLLDPEGRPRWNDDDELRGLLGALDPAAQLPALSALGQMGLLKVRLPEEDLLQLVEKPDVATALGSFTGSGGEAQVNWWDWSLSPEAARVLWAAYKELIGTGIDFSMDVLEAVTMNFEDWRRRRPGRNPELWNRANMVFENAKTPRARPLGSIGVADPGEGAIFADVGTLPTLHEAFAAALSRTDMGEKYRRLLGAHLEGGVLFVGDRPGSAVSVEPGSLVIEGSGIRSGSIGAGSIVVGTTTKELRAEGDCIVYGVQAAGGRVRARSGEVWADVMHRGHRHTVGADLFGPPAKEDPGCRWSLPHHGNPMSFSDLHAELTTVQPPATAGRSRTPQETGAWEPAPR